MTNKTCISPLATRPVLYTDTVGGKQTCRDDLWAVTTDELNALHCASPVAAPEAPTDTRSFWVLEKFADGRSAGYWDGGHSISFTNDINKACQFCRKMDAFWATRGWRGNDTQLTEHVMLSASTGADSPEAPASEQQALSQFANSEHTATCGNSHQSPYEDAPAPSAGGVGSLIVDAATTASVRGEPHCKPCKGAGYLLPPSGEYTEPCDDCKGTGRAPAPSTTASASPTSNWVPRSTEPRPATVTATDGAGRLILTGALGSSNSTESMRLFRTPTTASVRGRDLYEVSCASRPGVEHPAWGDLSDTGRAYWDEKAAREAPAAPPCPHCGGTDYSLAGKGLPMVCLGCGKS